MRMIYPVKLTKFANQLRLYSARGPFSVGDVAIGVDVEAELLVALYDQFSLGVLPPTILPMSW